MGRAQATPEHSSATPPLEESTIAAEHGKGPPLSYLGSTRSSAAGNLEEGTARQLLQGCPDHQAASRAWEVRVATLVGGLVVPASQSAREPASSGSRADATVLPVGQSIQLCGRATEAATQPASTLSARAGAREAGRARGSQAAAAA
jgi:hypothetical protein